MRVLVLDGSRVLQSLVRRLVPPGVEIDAATSFAQAMSSLRRQPPEAAIVDLTRADLAWSDLAGFCRSHRPPIPVLYESCVHTTLEEAGLAPGAEFTGFLAKPYHLAELRDAILRLLEAAAKSGPQATPPPGSGESH